MSGDLAITGEGRLDNPGDDAQTRLRHVANQFEASFVQMLFTGIDEEEKDDDAPLLGEDNAESQFKQLFHTGLSEQAAGHLGIATMLLKSIAPPAAHHSGKQQ